MVRVNPYRRKVPTIREAESAIGIPAHEWSGRCHEIASMVLDSGLVKGKLRYGMWLGKIGERNIFSGRPATHHGWIELEDGTIIDPTRWVFEDAEPYIWTGKNTGEYDKGSNVWRSMTLGLTPPAPSGKVLEVPLDDETSKAVEGLIGRKLPLTTGEWFWLANLSPETLGCMVKELYLGLQRADLKAFVPIDNWHDVMED